MILRYPSYMDSFNCKADKCSDNCCIGWEIDIDEDSFKKYQSVTGKIGNELKKFVSGDGIPHFILDAHERCPFLNRDNLCSIYIELGENYLCNICRDHPRFFEWYGDIKEAGIGLCCEEAAKVILSADSPFRICDITIPDEDSRQCSNNSYNYFYNIRENLLSHLSNSTLTLKQRLNDLLHYSKVMQQHYDNFDFTIYPIEAVSAETQFISKDTAEKILDFLNCKPEKMSDNVLFYQAQSVIAESANITEDFFKRCPNAYKYLENLASYFIWRHFLKGVYEEEFYSKAAFAVLMTAVCGILFAAKYKLSQKFTENDGINIAVYISKEIEYSEDNLEIIFDAFYENNCFTTERITSLTELLY